MHSEKQKKSLWKIQSAWVFLTHFCAFRCARNTAATQTGWNIGGEGSAPGSGETGGFGSDFTSADTAISTSTPSGNITLIQ